MSEKKLIRKAPGEVIDFETLFVENTAFEKDVPAHVGHVERVDYETDVYEDGVTYQKYCNVYLPWCYDPADKSRRYNVLYYQHGNTCDPEIFTGENQRLFDLIFDDGTIDPCIIVSTTYYFDVTKDVEERRRTGFVRAGDNKFPGVKAPNFYREVVESIIPAVEMKYNTYLEDPSRPGIRATRDHRAFSGYSRGAAATWAMFHNEFPYFRWYAPMSCMTTAGKTIREEYTREDVLAYLEQPIREHPDLPFFVFGTNGGPKDVVAMTEQMKYITKAPGFRYGKDPVRDNIYFSVSDFPHTDLLVPYYYYNSLQVLFKGI